MFFSFLGRSQKPAKGRWGEVVYSRVCVYYCRRAQGKEEGGLSRARSQYVCMICRAARRPPPLFLAITAESRMSEKERLQQFMHDRFICNSVTPGRHTSEQPRWIRIWWYSLFPRLVTLKINTQHTHWKRPHTVFYHDPFEQ